MPLGLALAVPLPGRLCFQAFLGFSSSGCSVLMSLPQGGPQELESLVIKSLCGMGYILKLPCTFI